MPIFNFFFSLSGAHDKGGQFRQAPGPVLRLFLRVTAPPQGKYVRGREKRRDQGSGTRRAFGRVTESVGTGK